MALPQTERYLTLLRRSSPYFERVGRVQDTEQTVVQQVREKLKASPAWMIPPVRLGRVAAEFQIQRSPERSCASGRGYIEFDKERQRFVIYLNRAQQPNVDTVDGGGGTRLDRFVYAHEFAHRFFFVPVADGWSRALAEVIRDSRGVEKYNIARSIPGIEEKICNNVATRLLVPREHLHRIIKDTIKRQTNAKHLLIDILRNVSQHFEVSWWCAIRRIAAVRPPELVAEWGPSYCCLLLGPSIHTGAGRGRLALRLLDFWWPQEIAGEPIKQAFPGLRLAHLGDDFAQRASMLDGNVGVNTEISWPMRFVSKERKPIDAILRGHCRTWSSTAEKRYLVYGTVSTN